MTGIMFFLTVFCGIFGGYVLIGIIYDALISMIGKGRLRNDRKYNRRISDNKRDS